MRNEKQGAGLGTLTLFAVGAYFLWENRFRIQKMLESSGIKTPWLTGNLEEGIRSGAAKVAGSVEHGMRNNNNATL